MSTSSDRDILNIDEAAELLGVSVKTFNKVLHAEALPARKIGREWKFSRRALIEWVGAGTSTEFYRENGESSSASGREKHETAARRSAGWQIELD
ncbi:MAG: helix-turn-helix domain-containing protein [Planctomycetota bacterium]|nr:helix-turn-helix domain-containing protein [Planctomycetota bacterium]